MASYPIAEQAQVESAATEPIPAAAPRRGGLRSVVQSLSAKLVIVGLNAGTGVLTARALHPEGRGELAAVLLWPQVLSGALALGLPSAITYHIRRDRASRRAYLLAGFALVLAIGAAASALAIALAPALLHQYRPEIVRTGRWLMPNLLIGMYLLLGRAALEAESDFAQSGLVLVGPPLLTLVGLTGLALLHRLTPVAAGITYSLSGIPAFVYLWSRLGLTLSQPLAPVLKAGRRLLSYGARSYGIDLCGTLGFYVDQALVVSLLSPEKMGTYVVALSASRVLNVPQVALAAVLFPSMVGRDRAGIAALTDRALRLGATLALASSRSR